MKNHKKLCVPKSHDVTLDLVHQYVEVMGKPIMDTVKLVWVKQ